MIFDTRQVRLNRSGFPTVCLGSLRDFSSLKSLEVSETVLLGNTLHIIDFPDQQFPVRVSQLLPPSLESLTLLIQSDYGYNDDWRIDEAHALWHLAEDCPVMLPKLKEIHVKSDYHLRAAHLSAYFEGRGVGFSFTWPSSGLCKILFPNTYTTNQAGVFL